MTKIKFYENEDKILGFSINGHTNFGQYGYDIVCASISATTTMTVNALLEILKVQNLKYDIKDGYMNVNLEKLSSIDLEKSQDFLKSLRSFLLELSKEYPKNLKFETGRYEL